MVDVKTLNKIKNDFGSEILISIIPFKSFDSLRDNDYLSDYEYSLVEIDDDENVIDNIFCTHHFPLFLSILLHYLRKPFFVDNSDLVSDLCNFVNSLCEENICDYFDIPNSHFRIYVDIYE